MPVRLFIIFLISIIIEAGCASQTMRDIGMDKLSPRKAEQELSLGINHYEDGHYQAAAKDLQNALNNGLAFKSDQVTAHKYLAFIHCASGLERQCKEEFKKALELDPRFELSPAEAGHPIWGPIFRSVKNAQSATKKK